MAADLHRGDLLIPSLLLTQDDINNNHHDHHHHDVDSFGSSGSSSGVSSPFSCSEGTVNSSVEEDEDYLAELTRQMAHFMLQEDEDKRTRTRTRSASSMTYNKPHPWSGDYSDVSAQTQSSVWTPLGQSHGGTNWEFPCDVAEKFEKMKLNMDKRGVQYQLNREPKVASSHQNNLYNHSFVQAFSDDEVRKHQMQLASVSRKKQPKCGYVEKGGDCLPRAPSATVPPRGAALQRQQQLQLQQTQPRTGSGMRAVFLGGSGPRSGSCGGTGVFLPCGTGNSSEPRKKSRCSTVLIPARVAHALMLHFNKMGGQSISNGGGATASFPTQQHDASSGGRNGLQKRQNAAAQGLNHNDLGLPQEWMY